MHGFNTTEFESLASPLLYSLRDKQQRQPGLLEQQQRVLQRAKVVRSLQHLRALHDERQPLLLHRMRWPRPTVQPQRLRELPRDRATPQVAGQLTPSPNRALKVC